MKCEPWPADDATTGLDAAQLALLRLLRLQKETRRSMRSRQREAAALLARSSLEGCILGLYCLHSDDAVSELRAANIKAGGRALGFLADAGIVPKEVIDRAVAAFGPSGRPPVVSKMVEHIDTATGGTAAVRLYRWFYGPASTFFVHANAASLLRHVKADNSLSDRPVVPWARRSTVRLADGCVGLLAGAIANASGQPSGDFAAYAEAHISRVLPPMVVFAGKGIARKGGLRQWFRLYREALQLRDYFRSPQYRNDQPEAREARVRAMYDKLVDMTMNDPEIPEGAIEPIVDFLVERTLSEWEAEHSQHQDTDGRADQEP